MDNRYKIIISNRNLYKEAELNSSAQQVRLGTQPGCDIRLHRDMFFETIDLTFVRKDPGWTVLCADNLYIKGMDDNVMKLRALDISHGDMFEVRYQDSDIVAFTVEFVIDFDDGRHKFNRFADCAQMNVITIGTHTDCNILLYGQYVGNDRIELIRMGDSFSLNILQTSYGVLHNGKKARNGEMIRNGDFLSIADHYFYLKNNKLWTEKTNNIQFQGIRVSDTIDRGNYPRFQRNSRVQTVVNDEKITVLDPAQKPTKPKNNLLLRLLPSAGMLIAAGLMVAINHSWTMIIFSGCSVVIGIITAILTLRDNNKEYNENLEKRTTEYYSYIERKKAEIEDCRARELSELEQIYISQQAENRNIHSFSPDLFDREADDPDFLCVRLGTGMLKAEREIDYKKQEKLEPDDELQSIPEQIKEAYEYIQNAPITVDLKENNAVGIIGQESFRYEIMKNMMIDLAARQFYADVSMIFVAEEKNKEKVRWIRFLPHVYNEALGIRNIVMDDESKTILFEYLYKELTFREQNKGFLKRIVVFLYDECGFQTHPISQFTEKAKDLGVTFIFFGNTRGEIPRGCNSLISLNDSQLGYLVNAADSNDQHGFYYPTLTQPQAERIVQLLAPVTTDEISLEGTLTRNISMFELLNIVAVDDIDLTRRWASTNVTKSMAAPIGVTKTGQIALDLHDKAHGPHGLVAGTTGSGKSEILQTYILAMTTLFHPYEVGFVIIDFKGGGMAGQFEGLPHLIGTITNIDGKEIDRSLKSIKAELKKRQRLFADADVNHIDKYIKLYKSGEVKTPLPHLIIIVDEFAELKAEQPDFMKELISAARIGRSLGVHLILATQKPAGQVNEQIWSNSRFKLCLKVQSKEDSNEVIKSPLAAEIKEPGRAYLQVGNNEIFELLQSAYSGAPEKQDDSSVREFSIIELTDSAKRVPVFVQKKAKSEENLTQLDAIVRYVTAYCDEHHITKLPDICLPSLANRIDFPSADQLIPGNFEVTTELGIFDDPDNQYQGTYSVDLANTNVMIIGSSQSGKTNLLQTMIRSIAMKYSPEEVTIYIIDFASMILKNFESLKHVGGVVTASEDEKLKNLMKLLKSEITARKDKLLSVGVSSFTAYREAGRTDLPQIVLMIDNITALKEMYYQDDDEIISLCREGLSVGISIVIANVQTQGIGYRYLSNFATRIALFCNDSGEYSNLFDHCRVRLDDIHGRSIVDIDKEHLECQIFLAFEGEKEIDRVRCISEFIAERNEVYAGSMTHLIPMIPEVLTSDNVAEFYAPLMQDRDMVAAGLDYSTVAPVVIDLASIGILALSGRAGMGQNNFIHYLVSMQERMRPGSADVHIIDGLGKRLRDMADLPQVLSYDYLPDKAAELIKQTEEILAARYEELTSGNETIVDDSHLIMLIINNQEALSLISNDRDALAAFQNITGRYKNMGVFILAAGFENANVAYGAPEVIKKIKDTRQFVFFDDLANLKILDMPLSVAREFKKPISPGDGYFIRENEVRKLKTPLVT